MTEFDKMLIEKAKSISRWHYSDIDRLIPQAETEETRERLKYRRWELYDLAMESV